MRAKADVRRTTLSYSSRPNCPAGKSLLIFRNRVKPRNQKYFASPLTQIRCISLTVPSRKRGVAQRHQRGAGCGGRGGVRRAIASRTNDAEAYGQVVSFWRPNAGVKSCEKKREMTVS